MPSRSSESGQILILTGLMAIIMFGIIGLSFDVGRMFAARIELSRAVDAAALAGVLEVGVTGGSPVTKAGDYLTANGATAAAGSPHWDANTNTLTVNATKSVRLYFLSVLGITSATVQGHAKAGFNNVTLDAVMVIDATSSMSGQPITDAKTAAGNFKSVLLGASPSGNVVVGVTPFRGCYRPSPKPAGSTNCVDTSTQVVNLTSNLTTLTNGISAITATGGSGTNVCIGLAKGYSILSGSGNHDDATLYPNNRRFLVLLSDGDNRYTGSYSYNGSPQSPESVTVGGTSYSCQPPSSCSNVGGTGSATDPCEAGTYAGLTTINDSFAAAPPWTSGNGWSGSWVPNTADTTVVGTYTSSPPPQDSTHSLRLGRGGSPVVNGSIYRPFSLATYATATVSYFVRRNASFTSTDQVQVQISTDGTTWTTLRTLTGTTGSSTSAWTQYSQNLNAYAGQATLYLRFNVSSMDSTSDQFYFDNINFTGTGSSSGFLNGDDNSNSCTGVSVKRERQLDMETRDLAVAMRAQGVEIYVVAFGVCATNSTVYTTGQCADFTTAGGQIGNTDVDNTADQRLLKCIASSKVSTNDHYFWASSSAGLPQIFSTIGAQIAQRLVE